jgi:predicted dehydrogenase
MKTFKKSSDIKVGVIGYGGAFNMGRAHLNEMRQAGMVPVAVAEIDPGRLAEAAKDFPGIASFGRAEEMLRKSDVKLLAIITPHNTHTDLALQCLKAGRHVVAEKPMAITTAECDRMIAAAKKSGVLLSTYHNRHWDGIILGALKHLKAGAIGDVVRVDVAMGGWAKPGDWWRSSKSISGGILYDWGVHLLEYTLQMVRSEVCEVSGHLWNGVWAGDSKWGKDTIEDEGFLTVRFRSGAWASLRVTGIEERPHTPWFKVLGTKGSMVLDWGATEFTTHVKGNQVTTRVNNPQSEGWRFYQNIADHLTGKAELVITPEWSRRPIHILDLACRSAGEGRALKAKYG